MATAFGSAFESEMARRREERQEIAYAMFGQGGHSAKEIAEAMGTTSLHEVSALLDKYNERQIAKGKPPAVLRDTAKLPPAATSGTKAASESADADQALLDQIALQALTIAVADCDDGIRAAQVWRKALASIDAWLTAMLPEIRKAPGAVQAWAQIAAVIAMEDIDDE